MQRRLLIATLVLSSLLLIVGVLPINGEAQIYDTVVRLHVLANSDSDEDQALKLKVRDDVLAHTEKLIGEAASRDEAEAILQQNLDTLKEVAVLEQE